MKSVLFFSCFVVILLSCCDNNNYLPDSESDSIRDEVDYATLYQDSVFWGFEGDFYEKPYLIWENYDIYEPAAMRMLRHLNVGSNELTWNFKCASDLKISQNIYDYIINSWTYTNTVLQDTNNILVKDGISYRVKYGKSNALPMTKTAHIVDNSEINYVMGICCGIIRQRLKGPLTNYIDVAHSTGWTLDGAMGHRLYNGARLGMSDQSFHYCVSINRNSKNFEYDHTIQTSNVHGSGVNIYEIAGNRLGAPLVTVRNRRGWEAYNGY